MEFTVTPVKGDFKLPADPKTPYVVHVDGDVLKNNRERRRRDPIVRVVDTTTGIKYYANWIVIKGACWLDTRWDQPLPDRPNAICVVRTYAALEFGMGPMKYKTRGQKKDGNIERSKLGGTQEGRRGHRSKHPEGGFSCG